MSGWYEIGIDNWEPYSKPSVIISSGPERVVTDEPDPHFKRRPIGFTAPETGEAGEAGEPLLWEGDGS